MIKKKKIFLHVPKTAGSSLSQTTLVQKCHSTIHPIHPAGAWETLEKEGNIDAFKFAFVRNPWDRFVSLYFYFYNMTSRHFAYKYDHQTATNIKRFKNFEDFCLNFHDFDDRQPFKKFHFFNQHLWTHSQGKCFIDFLGKYENLDQDVASLQNIFEIPHEPVSHTNQSDHGDYKNYYNSRTRNVVAEIYKKDIEYFEYKFS